MSLPKLLLIEPNQRISKKLSSVLRPFTKAIYTASSGTEGITSFRKNLPQIVITEQFLPQLSGEELSRQLRKHFSSKEVKIVMLCSSRFGEPLAETVSHIDQILRKPLQTQQLKKLIPTLFPTEKDILSLSLPKDFPEKNQLSILKGDLRKTELATLLFQLQREKFSGVLKIHLPQGSRNISLQDGQVVYAESLISNEQFLSLVHKRFSQQITLEELEKQTIGSYGRAFLQKEALEKSGLLPKEFLNGLFDHYAREILVRSLSLKGGRFQLVNDQAYAKRTYHQKNELLFLLFESIQRASFLEDMLQEFTPDFKLVCFLSDEYEEQIKVFAECFPMISFAPEQLHQKTLREVLYTFSHDLEFNAQLLKTLYQSELIHFQKANLKETNPLVPKMQESLSSEQKAPSISEQINTPKAQSAPTAPYKKITSENFSQIKHLNPYDTAISPSDFLFSVPSLAEKMGYHDPTKKPKNKESHHTGIEIAQIRSQSYSQREDSFKDEDVKIEPKQWPLQPPSALLKSVRGKKETPKSNTSLFPNVSRDFLRVQSQNYFQVLGISEQANQAEIEQAYAQLSKQYTPTQKQSSSLDINIKINEIYHKIQNAWTILKNPKMLQEHRKKRSQKVYTENLDLYAREQYELGLKEFERKQFSKAVIFFQEAFESDQKKANYYLYLGWAIYKSTAQDELKVLLAKSYIEKSIKMAPTTEDGYLYLGLLYRQEGKYERAKELFKKLSQLNPHHVKAHQQIKELKELMV